MTREFMMFIYFLLFIYMAGMIVLITWLYKSKKPFVTKGFYSLFILAYIGLLIYLIPQEIRIDIKPLFLYGMFILMFIGTLASIFPVIGGIRAVWRWYFLYRNGIVLKSENDVCKFIFATFEQAEIRSTQLVKDAEKGCFAWKVVLNTNKDAKTVFLSIKAKHKQVEVFDTLEAGTYKINGYKVRFEDQKMYPLEICAPSRK